MKKRNRRFLTLMMSLAIAGTTCGGAVTGIMPVFAQEVREGAPGIIEDFDTYENTDALRGYTFGNPVLSIVENGELGKGLRVSERTQGYFAYAYDVKAFAGNKIQLSADIHAVNVEADAQNHFGATLKMSESGKDDTYNGIAGGDAIGTQTVTIEGTYDIPAGGSEYAIYFETAENVDYVIDNISITVVGDYSSPEQGSVVDTSQYQQLKELYKDNFKMGVACEAISHWNNSLSEIGNPDKEKLMLHEFNSITFGNELKPEYNMGCKSAGATDTNVPFVIDKAAREMLDWAKANKMSVRGHVLVWHAQCADEVFCKNYTPVYLDDGKTLDPSCYVDKDIMEKRTKSYIDNVIKYMYENGYGDVIYAWDVVNEAVEPGTNVDNLRNSYWYQIMGKDFILNSFKYTREAVEKYAKEYAKLYGIDDNDETAVKSIEPKLFYNDYNEFQADKRDAIIANLKPVKDAGYIDGIGMQSHLSDTTNLDSFMEALKMYAKEFGEVQLTELDVAQTSSGVNAGYYQAVFYNKLFKELINAKQNGVNISGVTIWGLTDDNSWKKESSPLVFNSDLSKKAAFDAIVAAKTGEEIEGPTYEAPDFKDAIYTFETDTEGFAPRGDGKVEVQSDVVFTGKSAIHDSGRTANWNGAAFDVSRFAGQTISVSAWVKSDAKKVKLSADIDGSWPNIATADTSNGDWVQIRGTYSIPKELTGLKLYFEGTDLSDIYIDNVEVKLVGLDERFEDSTNIASPRGVGHMPKLNVVEDGDSKKALLVTRDAQEASMKFDVSKYVGQTVKVTALVKTSDEKITLGLDGDQPLPLTTVDGKSGEYVEVSAVYAIPNSMTSANMYIETNGTADFYVDAISVRMDDYVDDVEKDFNFSTRWGGAGTIAQIEEENGNHVAKLTDRDESYYGLAFDVSSFLGDQVEISFDVKTDDKIVKLSGDIDGSWPNYMSTTSEPGKYKNVSCFVQLPNDLQALKVYVETEGKSDIYIDNLRIKRVATGKQYKVTLDEKGDGKSVTTMVATENQLLPLIEAPHTESGELLGWYKDANCTKLWDFSTDRVAEDTKLYAKTANENSGEQQKPVTGGTGSTGGSGAAGSAGGSTKPVKPVDNVNVDKDQKPEENENQTVQTEPEKQQVEHVAFTKHTKVIADKLQNGLKITVNTQKNGTSTVAQIAKNNQKTIKIEESVMVEGVKYKVTQIGKNAFAKCKKTTKIVLPGTIEKIAENAFTKTSNSVKTIELTGKKAPVISTKAFKGVKTENMTIKTLHMKKAELKKLKLSLKKAGFKGKVATK